MNTGKIESQIYGINKSNCRKHTFWPPSDLILPSAAGLCILRNSADKLKAPPLENSTSI